MLWYRLRSLSKSISLYNTFLLSFFSIAALSSELFSVRNVLKSLVFWKNIRDATCYNIAGSHKWLRSICMSSDTSLPWSRTFVKRKREKKAILFLLWCSIYKCVFFFCLLYHLNFAPLSLAVWDWKPAVVFFPPFVPPLQLQRVWISHKIQKDTGRMNWAELKWELV